MHIRVIQLYRRQANDKLFAGTGILGSDIVTLPKEREGRNGQEVIL